MKKLLSLLILVLGLDCLATGTLPINSSQSGYFNFATNGAAYTSATNIFAPAYSYVPVVSTFLFAGPTNALPLTVTTTTSNLIVSINTSTNCTVYWTASSPNYIIQSGVIVASAVLATNVTFPTAFASVPQVFLTGSVLVTNPVVTSISATNFNLSVSASNTVQWMAFGPVLNRPQTGPNGTDGVVTH